MNINLIPGAAEDDTRADRGLGLMLDRAVTELENPDGDARRIAAWRRCVRRMEPIAQRQGRLP